MNEKTPELQLDPEDIILLLLEANEKLLGKRALAGVTRLEKLLFLLQKETEFEKMDLFYLPSYANFIFVRVGVDDLKLCQAMARKGVLMSPMTTIEILNDITGGIKTVSPSSVSAIA